MRSCCSHSVHINSCAILHHIEGKGIAWLQESWGKIIWGSLFICAFCDYCVLWFIDYRVIFLNLFTVQPPQDDFCRICILITSNALMLLCVYEQSQVVWNSVAYRCSTPILLLSTVMGFQKAKRSVCADMCVYVWICSNDEMLWDYLKHYPLPPGVFPLI